MIINIINFRIWKQGGSLLIFLLLLSNSYRPKLNAEQIQNINSDFTKSELEYFYELTFKNEIKAKSVKLKKWNKDIKIGLIGEYTKEDSLEVGKIVNELNEIINTVDIKTTTFDNSNLKMHFISYEEFDKYYKYASIGTYGFFLIKHDSSNEITSGLILINKSLSGNDRKSTIRNEISNSLGLINDSYKYPASAFQQFENKNITYDEIDQKVISLLYNYSLPTGLDGEYFKECFLDK
jgi:hypothetical protein